MTAAETSDALIEALVGVKKCGCAVRAMVNDDQTTQKDRAQFYRECARDDMTVERWTVGRVRSSLRRCKCEGESK